MTTEERARELWKKLPITQEDYTRTIEHALKEQRKEDLGRAWEYIKNEYVEWYAYDIGQDPESFIAAEERDFYVEMEGDHFPGITKMVIGKACEWLEMHIEYWLYDDGFLDVPAMLKDFRKAMEE